MIKNGMRPIHPGEVLKEEYLDALICLNCDAIYLDTCDLVRIE